MLSEVTNDPPIQECHAAAQDNLNSKGDKEIYSKEKQARQSEKIKQQLRFFKDVTLADVTIDEDHLIPLSVNSTSRTMVQDIKGVEPSKIGARVLRQICVILRLKNYNGKSKLVTLDMIGQRKKNEHLELSDDGFIDDTPRRKRKTSSDLAVAPSATSRSQQLALDRFIEFTKERYFRVDVKSAASHEWKAKRIRLQTKRAMLSLYTTYRDGLSKARKDFKELRLEDDYKSDGSEAEETRNAITLYQDRMEADFPTGLTTAISSIGT